MERIFLYMSHTLSAEQYSTENKCCRTVNRNNINIYFKQLTRSDLTSSRFLWSFSSSRDSWFLSSSACMRSLRCSWSRSFDSVSSLSTVAESLTLCCSFILSRLRLCTNTALNNTARPVTGTDTIQQMTQELQVRAELITIENPKTNGRPVSHKHKWKRFFDTTQSSDDASHTQTRCISASFSCSCASISRKRSSADPCRSSAWNSTQTIHWQITYLLHYSTWTVTLTLQINMSAC